MPRPKLVEVRKEVAQSLIGLTWDQLHAEYSLLPKNTWLAFAVLDGERTLWEPHKTDGKNLIIVCTDENERVYKAFVNRIPPEEMALLPKRNP